MKFDNFYRDMFPSYYPTATIERTDYNGNYEKANCKWLDASLQGKNKRTVPKYTFKGETLIGWDWDRKMGLKLGTVRSRIKEFNWSIEKAITTKRKQPAAKYFKDSRGRYQVRVNTQGKTFFVGRFDTAKEALAARAKFLESLLVTK